jgi:hypothetical protein
MNREERQRIVSQNRERLGEALAAHGLSDDESERALLEIGLADEQAALEKLAHTDPVGLCWFGHDDAWIGKRIGKG